MIKNQFKINSILNNKIKKIKIKTMLKVYLKKKCQARCLGSE